MKKGRVYLVGAGPGDPGLITVKGRDVLRRAQVVVYDRLVNERLLSEAPGEAELIYAGKGTGGKGMSQSAINALLVDRAKGDKLVVRLKGGDPFVFGRGGEEAEALAAAGLPFEVVPGITSAIAVPAYAGIPLTHRGVSASFTVLMGREDRTKEWTKVEWEKLATGAGTLVVLMGAESLEQIATQLAEHGLAATTPAAAIEWGTGSNQRTVTGTLSTIAAKARAAQLAPPAVTVFGKVVRLRETLRWFDAKPLFGKRVLVTRSRTQVSALATRLEEAGAEVLAIPTIEIRPPKDWQALDAAIARLGIFDWLIFASTNAVEMFFERLQHAGQDARALGRVKVCAIGTATGAALRQQGLVADFVPEQFTSEAVAAGLGERLRGQRVFLPRADIAPEDVLEALAKHGAMVEQAVAYRTVAPKEGAAKAKAALSSGAVQIVTFTSSSTVENLMRLLGSEGKPLLARVQLACIGPATAKTAERLGLAPAIVAKEHTIPGLVEAIIAAAGQRGKGEA